MRSRRGLVLIPTATLIVLSLSGVTSAQQPISEIGTPAILTHTTGTTTIDHQRGSLLYNDTFDRYPTSNDPIFDRFQISMHGRSNGAGGFWTAFDHEFIPTLFVPDQVDASGAPDPMPRWIGADLTENTGETILGDVTGDFLVDTTDLGVLVGSFGASGANIPSDLNDDGFVDTADLGILISAFGDNLGPFCLYQVSEVHEFSPDGTVIPQFAIDLSPAAGDIIALPTSQGSCGLCSGYRYLPPDETVQVYGEWTLIDAEAATVDLADYLAESISQQCEGWGEQEVLALARSESDINIPACCFYSLFSPLSRQSNASPVNDVVTDVDLFLTGHQTFLWLQGVDNGLRPAWDVMLGGVAAFLDPNLIPFANEEGELDVFIVRQSPQVPGAGAGLFYGTVDDIFAGSPGKKSLVGEWFTMRMVLHSNSTFEFWVRDSETEQLANPIAGDDSDGVSDDGFARLVPSGPYGPAIWNMQPGIAAPNPFLVATPSLRQFQWLWGGDPSPEEDPDYVPANWFMDNLRVSGPF